MTELINSIRDVLGATLAPRELGELQVVARGVLIYVALIVILRFGKRRSLSRATPLDVVIVITVGSIASRGITGNAPLLSSIVGVASLIAVHWAISFITRDNTKLGALIEGKPRRIIVNGDLDQAALHVSHMSEEDLKEDLRQSGVLEISDVKLAVLERSGRLSVIKAPT